MNHISDDQLLLYAYGDVPDTERPAVEAHLGECPDCRGRLAGIEEGRVALEWGSEQRSARRSRRLLWLAVPLAAGLGALLLTRGANTSSRPPEIPEWQSHLMASPHAGYLTNELIPIDAQLQRLEQGRIHD